MLGEEKSKRNWSILMSSQDTVLLLYSMMSSYGDPVSPYSYIFPIKANDIIISNDILIDLRL